MLSGLVLGVMSNNPVNADELTDKENQIKTELSSLTKKRDELKKAKTDKDASKKKLDEELGKTKPELETAKSNVKDTEKSKDDLKSVRENINKVKTTISERQKKIDESFGLVKLSEAKNPGDFIKQVQEVATGKDSKLDKLEGELDKSVEKLKETREVYEVEVEESNKQVKSISELEQKVNQTTEQQSTLAEEIKDIESQLKELEGKIPTKETELKGVQAEIKKKSEQEAKKQAATGQTSSGTPAAITSNSSKVVKFTSAEDQALWNKVKDVPIGGESGLRPHVAQVRRFLKAKFGLDVIGGWRGDSDGQGTGHSDGLAIDLMLPVGTAGLETGDKGDEIAKYLAANMKELDMNYLIWEQRFFSLYNSWYGGAGTWGWMPDRGSLTQNHFDHVHISFNK